MHKTKVTAFLASLVVTLVLPFATQAATYTVTKTADTADGTCDSDCSLREAVIAANTGSTDTIIIPAGTYPFTRTAAGEEAASTGDLDFTDTDLTTITGAGSGLGGGATIIDPDDNDRGIDVKSGAAVSITALTINDGNLSSAAGSGAGILNAGSLTLDNVYVTGNTLTTAGSSDGYGVGIMCSGSQLNITNSVISNNIGTSASGNVVGGGLDIASTCSATLSDVTISGNQAMHGGGVAVFTASNVVSFTDVTISNNIAGDAGGGIFVQGDDVATPVNISRALFQDNDATNTGGGVFATAPLNIVNASFYGNHAGDAGGAFGTDSSTSPRINLAFVTMTRNTADSAGPGLYVGGATPDTHIKNSIVASNNHTADINDFEDCSGVPISDDYNYIAATGSCDMVPAAHDIVGTEAGSVYFTATPSDEGGNVFVTALWETGVTLDMIPSANCTDGNDDPVATDARGTSRPQNVRCDLGAFEKTDAVTQTPTLISPTSSSSQRTLNLQYSLPETPSLVTVTITNGSSVTRTLTMQTITSVSTTVDLASLASTTNVTGVAGGASLPDGTYTVTLSYQDATGNAAATASATGVLIDTVTQTPTLTAPASSSTASSINLQYTLSETPTAGTVSVAFTGSATRTLTMSNSTSVNTTVNLASLSSTSGVTSVAGGASLPDGTYTVTLSYQDALGNAAATAVATGVVIDTVTQTPTLTAPASSSTASSINLQYTLPETPLSNTVKVTFTGSVTRQLTMSSSTSVNVTVNLASLASTSNVASVSGGTTLPDGTYTVSLAYQDALGNTAATSSATSVTIDTSTSTPILTSPATGTTNSLHLQYTLPETPLASSVQVIFTNASSQTSTFNMGSSQSVNLTFSPSSTNSAVLAANASNISNISSAFTTVLPDGVYSVTLLYQDAVGNPSATASASSITVDATAPIITLLGDSTTSIAVGEAYTEAGATATDAVSGNLTSSIVITGTVDTAVVGTYTVSYNVSDAATNAAATVTRTVNVIAAATDDTDDDNTDDANDDPNEEELIDDGGQSGTIVTTNGKIVTIKVDGVTVDQAQVGNKRLGAKYYRLVTKSIYQEYDSVIVLTTTKRQAKLTVFRLTSAQELKKKFDKTFAITQRKRLRLKVKTATKKISVTVGVNDQQVKQLYRLTRKGRLKAM